jgi:hypothetical protein
LRITAENALVESSSVFARTGSLTGIAVSAKSALAAFNAWMFMRQIDDVSELTPDQRRRELVAILAAGVLRLRQRRLRAGEPAAPPDTSPKSSAAGLEVGAETVLSVHTG